MSTESMVTQAVLEKLTEWRRGEVQAIGAAISTRNWHSLETAYNALRDKMDRVIHSPSNTRTAAQPEREAVLEEAAMIVDQFASGRRYCEPTEWDYGAQDALVVSAKTIRALKATPAPAVSTDEIVAALTEAREALHFHYVEWDGEPEDAVPLQLARSKCDAILSRLRGEGK